MCRIAGLLHAALPPETIEQMVRKMCDIQKHGGPDDEGFFTCAEGSLVLGNRRLALLDLSPDGHMPMQYRQRYHITYNGELYNFRGIREELIALGHHFNSHTDTEVIVAAFAQWHTQAFSRLKGMFAFAIWDSTEQELFIARDPSGIKPLYYSLDHEHLAFASEIRAFKAIPACTEKNTEWPVYMMAYGHLPEPVSTFRHVKPLHKGFFLKYSAKSGKHSLESFNHYSYSEAIGDPVAARQQIREALDASVRRHLIADAPLGVFLSGGLDSGILTTLAATYQKDDLNTLSIYFKETAYSEKKYQDLIIDKVGCKSHQYLLQEDEFHESLPEILRAMDMPSCDGINTWFISKYAAMQGLKAVLSGVGGDELFGGYPSFNRLKAARMIQQLPGPVLKSGRKSGSKKLNRMSYLDMDGIKGVYLFLRGHYSPFDIARQLDMDEKQVWNILNSRPVLMDVDILEHKNQASWMEYNMYMQNQLLRDSDVMSMIHGVEIRVPFLDDDLVKLAISINPGIKYTGSRPKQVLIDIFRDELPEQIWNRPKMGFSFPFAQWLRGSEYVKELMLQSGKNSQVNYQKFLQGKMHWSHLMSLVIMRSKGVC